MSDNISIALPATALANSWLRVANAQGQDESRPALYRSVCIEVYRGRGVRLVSTDSYLLLHRWVSTLDLTDEPDVDEAPDQTVVAMDVDHRGKQLMAFLQKQHKDEPTTEVLIQTGAGLLPEDSDEPTLAPEFDRIGCAFTSPGERLVLPVFDGEWVTWRKLVKTAVERGVDKVEFGSDVARRLAIAHAGGSFEIIFSGPSAMMRTESLALVPTPLHGFVMPIRSDDLVPKKPKGAKDDETDDEDETSEVKPNVHG